jgi:hypothetical protein
MNLSQDNWCLNWDSIQAPPRYKLKSVAMTMTMMMMICVCRNGMMIGWLYVGVHAAHFKAPLHVRLNKMKYLETKIQTQDLLKSREYDVIFCIWWYTVLLHSCNGFPMLRPQNNHPVDGALRKFSPCCYYCICQQPSSGLRLSASLDCSLANVITKFCLKHLWGWY